MSKGVFTTWIKELCALVFTQTIQAFILAIVLSIILTFIAPTGGNISSSDSVSALGVLCILLLTSLTKMEQITRKIFGLESGIMSNKPPHGLMASFMALKAAGRILNNVPKMAGGVASVIGSGTDKKKAQTAMLSRLNRKGLDRNGNPIGEGAAVGEALPAGGADLMDSSEYLDKAKEAKNKGDMRGYERNRGIAAGMDKAKKSMAANATAPSRLKDTSKLQDDYYKILDKYDDEISKAKEKRRQGWSNVASGASETVGAVIGGGIGLSTGLVTGLATGDYDQIHKATAYGIGIGDAAGENLTKAVSTVSTGIKTRAKANSSLDKQLAQMEANLKINNSKRETQAKRVRNITQKIEKDIGIQ